MWSLMDHGLRPLEPGMGRRFWTAWAICFVVMLAVLGAGWLTNPTDERASAGTADVGQSLPPRIGFVMLIVTAPLVLAAFRLAKIPDRGSASRVVVPGLLAFALVCVTWLDAFVPDAVGCSGFNIERFGPLDPECTTAISTRTLALAEMTLAWVLFALVAVAADRLQRRRVAKRRTNALHVP